MAIAYIGSVQIISTVEKGGVSNRYVTTTFIINKSTNEANSSETQSDQCNKIVYAYYNTFQCLKRSDLCCDSLEKSQEILKCEGDCGCTVHRYCAGVTKRHYEDLTKGSTPFVCQWCNLKLARTTIQQLQSEVASLKLELVEAKAAATTSKLQSSDSLATRSYASAAAQPPRNQPDRSNSARGQQGAQRPRASSGVSRI